MTLATLLLPLLAVQSVGEALVAVKNDNPETWTVEYPRLIQPYVQDYRRCLAVTNRNVTGTANFEAQHAADLPRCADRRAKAVADSNAALAGAKTGMTAEEIEQLFTNIGRIHIARGADLDKQFRQRMAGAEAASANYEATRPKGLVIELRDASVVKARTDATAAAASQKDKDAQ
ncbi:hypothetical protein OIK40_03300 [Erythrobacter sp. sf7]|uniref:Uncharacterized protein n=1 Tax=Erythrobacter fulvus TaxID=2987523 RepID=A0ABT5JM29_9SPHN|nr:hypothetical protein [Erythrobacter fulvus]MDC8753663.1 hypothetical protein [Erythrobacter fulvus]